MTPKPRPDLMKLAKEVYEANLKKGFHDPKESNEILLMLVISELSEAVEADRKGKWFSLIEYEVEVDSKPKGWIESDKNFKKVFDKYIKDSVGDELADAVIRLLDLSGLNDYDKLNINANPFFETSPYFAENIYHFVRLLTLPEIFSWGQRINRIISQIEYYCWKENIDLWKHVELKLRYNTLREFKHGKSY